MISFGEMFSGIAGFRYGLERCNFGLEKAENRWSSESFRKDSGTRRDLLDSSRTEDEHSSSYRCVWANDWDKYACQIYRKNFGDKELVEADIRTIDPDTIPDFDLLTAGFPCQSFSLAGKRKGFEDTRGTLFYEVARVAKAKRPRLLLLENVKGLLSNDEGRTFAKILQTLDGLGYDVEWQVLNSKYFGVPQNRERVFIVGHLRGESSKQIFPIGEVGEGFDESCGERNLISSALIQSQGREPHIETRKDDVSHALKGKGGWEGNYLQIANTISHRYGKDGSENLILQQHSHSGEDGKGRGIRVFENEVPTLTQQMGTGGNNVPMVVDAKKQGEPRFYQGQSPSLQANDFKEPLKVISGQRIRRLTPTECERLQGFPDGWTEGVSDTQRYKLLGNAVTTNVISFLGEKLLEASV